MKESRVFKPRYSLLLWVLALLYAAPFLFGAFNAALGASRPDLKIFWLLAGTVWLLAGLLQLQEALLKRIVFGEHILIQMVLQRDAEEPYEEPVRIFGDVAVFRGQRVQMRYLANAGELMQMFVSLAGMGRMDMVYEEGRLGGGGWSAERNLACLTAFAVYMMAMLALRADPLGLVGPATDAFLLGWAAMLPVLGAVKLVRYLRDKSRWQKEEKEKWTT